MTQQTFQPHPLSLVMPDMTPAEFQSLTDSIRQDGQLEEIILHEGKILDGRHRYQACINLGLNPVMREYDTMIDGNSPANFVLSKNLWRRHLSISQRAVVAAEIKPFFEAEAAARQAAAQIQPGSNVIPMVEPAAEAGRSAEKAAELLGVSESSVKRAAAIVEADPALAADVKAGKVTVTKAAKKVASKKAASGLLEGEFAKKEALEKITKDHGEEFGKALMRGDVLKKAKDFDDFMTLDVDDQNKVKELVLARWTVRKALDFLSGIPTEETKIKDLMLRLNAQTKKKLAWTVGAFTVSIARE